MRKLRPLRWIEAAEERQVLAAAISEAPSPDTANAPAAPSLWAEAWRRWLRVSAGPQVGSTVSATLLREADR